VTKFIRYLITDKRYYQDKKQFKRVLHKSLKKHKPSFVCYRDKSTDDFSQYARIFVNSCKKYRYIDKILLNQNFVEAKKQKCDGVHLSSSQFGHITKARRQGLFVTISCHTLNDIKKAKNSKANMVTYSPLFKSPDKGVPLGLFALKKAIKLYNIPIIALGGVIQNSHIYKLKATNTAGFASIRHFFG